MTIRYGVRLSVLALFASAIAYADEPTGPLPIVCEIKDARIEPFAFSPDGKTIAVGRTMKIELFDPKTGKSKAVISGTEFGGFSSLVWSEDGTKIFTGGSGGYGPSPETLLRWDLKTGKEEKVFKLPAPEKKPGGSGSSRPGIKAVALSPDGKSLASGDDSGTVRLWDATKGTQLLTFSVRQNESVRSISALAYSPDGKTFAAATGREVRIYDAATGEENAKLLSNNGAPLSLRFSPDGKTLASLEFSNGVRLWDVGSGKEQWLSKNVGRAEATAIAGFTPEGKAIAVSYEDGTVAIRDAATGDEQLTLSDIEKECRQVAFSSDGKLLAAIGKNGIVVWNTANMPAAMAKYQEMKENAREKGFPSRLVGEWTIGSVANGVRSSPLSGSIKLTIRDGVIEWEASSYLFAKAGKGTLKAEAIDQNTGTLEMTIGDNEYKGLYRLSPTLRPGQKRDGSAREGLMAAFTAPGGVTPKEIPQLGVVDSKDVKFYFSASTEPSATPKPVVPIMPANLIDGLPNAVAKAFQAKHAKAKVISTEQGKIFGRGNGPDRDTYSIMFDEGKGKVGLMYGDDGTPIANIKPIPNTSIPKPVMAAFKKKYPELEPFAAEAVIAGQTVTFDLSVDIGKGNGRKLTYDAKGEPLAARYLAVPEAEPKK